MSKKQCSISCHIGCYSPAALLLLSYSPLETLLLLSCSPLETLLLPHATLPPLSCYSPGCLLLLSCSPLATLLLLSCYSPATLMLLSCYSPATLLLSSYASTDRAQRSFLHLCAALAKSLSPAATDSVPALAQPVKCAHACCPREVSVAHSDGLHGNVFTHTARQEICGVLSSAIVACCWFKCLC